MTFLPRLEERVLEKFPEKDFLRRDTATAGYRFYRCEVGGNDRSHVAEAVFLTLLIASGHIGSAGHRRGFDRGLVALRA